MRKKGAFIRGRRFLEVGRLFEAIRYNFCLSSNSAKLIRTIIGQFLKSNKIAPKRIQNGRKYAHAQHLNAYNFCLSSNSAKLIRTIIGQFLKDNKIAP